MPSKNSMGDKSAAPEISANRESQSFALAANGVRGPAEVRPIGFLLRQARAVREGGIKVFLSKALAVLSLPLLLPVILMIRMIRPLVLIRFGPLRSNLFGLFAFDTEVYLCESDAGIHGRRTFDIFYHLPPVCNIQLKIMWERKLHFFPFANRLYWANHQLPGGGAHVIPRCTEQERDVHGLLAHTHSHISFTREEERLGQAALRQMGIPEGAPFVCFHARDPAYFVEFTPSSKSHYVADYRNANIQNYVTAAEELARRGYYAIRMGSIVGEPLSSNHPMVIDYAVKHRTEFLDIYLGAKCRFFLSSDNGAYAVAATFRRPIAWTNYGALEYVQTWDPNQLFIPKKLWQRGEDRLLTFREILDSGIGRLSLTQEFEQRGIDLIDNTPDEINAVAVEMVERLNGTWQTTGEDEEMQRHFWSLFPTSELHGELLSRIGADFLRENRNLLD